MCISVFHVCVCVSLCVCACVCVDKCSIMDAPNIVSIQQTEQETEYIKQDFEYLKSKRELHDPTHSNPCLRLMAL